MPSMSYRTITKRSALSPITFMLVTVMSVVWTNLAVAQSVGTVSGLQTNVFRNGRQLSAGQAIFTNDVVQTNETGITQFLFNDRSSAKLGPNSEIQFTEEVVQIGGRQSSVAIRMAQGIARFIGSDATKQQPMVVSTPNFSLGVMGGIAEFNMDGNGAVGVLISGIATCISGNQVATIRRTGFGCVSAPGGGFSVEKIDLSFSQALDSTAIPNASGSGASTRVSPGSAPIAEVATAVPLGCGSNVTASTTRCGVDSGGYPYPQPNETVSPPAQVISPPSGTGTAPAPTIIVVNDPPTGGIRFQIVFGRGTITNFTVDDINDIVAIAGIASIDSTLFDPEGDPLVIVSGSDTDSTVTLTPDGNGFTIDGISGGPGEVYNLTIVVSDGVNTVTIPIVIEMI